MTPLHHPALASVTVGYAADAGADLADLAVRDPASIDLVLEAWVAVRARRFPSEYRFRMATPDALIAGCRARDPFFRSKSADLVASRATIVVAPGTTWENVESHVKATVSRVTGDTVGEIADELQRMYVWEFDDYQQGGSFSQCESLYVESIRHETGEPFRDTWPGSLCEVDYDLTLELRHDGGAIPTLRVNLVTPEALKLRQGKSIISHGSTLILRWSSWRDAVALIHEIIYACGHERPEATTWRLRRFFADYLLGGP